MSENKKEKQMGNTYLALTSLCSRALCSPATQQAGLADWHCQSSSPPRQEDRDVCPRRARTRPATSWSPACFPRHVDAADRCVGAVWIQPSPSFTHSPSLPLSLSLAERCRRRRSP